MTTDNEFDSAFDGNADDNPRDDVNYLEELVGEGKKFKSHEDLARGKWEADSYIKRLEREQEELRQELSRAKNIEEFMDQLNSRRNERSNNEGEPKPRQPNSDDDNSTQGLTPEQIEQMIQDRLTRRESESKMQSNERTVIEKMESAWGRNYKSELAQKARELDMSGEELKNYARSNPKAFFRLVGLEAPARKESNPTLPESSYRFGETGNEGVKNKRYYDKMKEKDPKLYWSPKVQQELHKEAMKLGSKFFE